MKKILLVIIVSLFTANSFAQSGIQFPKTDSTSVHKHYPICFTILGAGTNR